MLEIVGATVGRRYKIIGHLGGGGFGETYLAEDTEQSGFPRCVVKHLKTLSIDADVLAIARRLFASEVSVLQKLGDHDRIPKLFDYFEEGQEFYLVQQFIEGHDLGQELSSGRQWDSVEAIELLQDVLSVLEFVHQHNVVHRDIKPQNLIRRKSDGKIVLIDFGAVKQIYTTSISTRRKGRTNLTIQIGTPGYMPSEQANGYPKLSSDIYGVGMIGIQALTGIPADRIPIDPDTLEVAWHDYAQSNPALMRVLDKMVRFDFRQRYQSATEALRAVAALTAGGEPTIVRPSVLPTHNANQARQRKSFGSVSWIAFAGLGAASGVALAILNASKFTPIALQSRPAVPPIVLTPVPTPASTLSNPVDGSTPLVPPPNAADFYKEGTALAANGRYAEAIDSYDKAIALRSNYYSAWYERAVALNSLKRYAEAVDSYDKAIALRPDDAQLWVLRGSVLDSQKKYKKALESFEQATQIAPRDSGAWVLRGQMLEKLQRNREAIAAYNKAIKLKPDYLVARERLRALARG